MKSLGMARSQALIGIAWPKAINCRLLISMGATLLVQHELIPWSGGAERKLTPFTNVADVDGSIDSETTPFSFDGKRFVTVSPDRRKSDVYVWDANTCSLVTPAIHPDGNIIFCELSADGTVLLTGDTKKRIGIWDVGTSELRWTKDIGHELLSAILSPDGKRFVTNGEDTSSLQLWRIGENNPYATLAHRKSVTFAIFDSSGSKIVTRDWVVGASVHLWDAMTGAEICKPIESNFDAEADTLQTAMFDRRGQHVVFARKAGFAMADAASGKILSMGQFGGNIETQSIRFSGDGLLVAVVTMLPMNGAFGSVQIFDATTGRLIRAIAPGTAKCEISPDGSRLFCGNSESHSTDLWDLSDGSKIQTFDGLIGAMWLSPDGKAVAFNHKRRTSIWRVVDK